MGSRRGAVYPDFLGIGAQKAGTTWLSRNLQAHPEIWMPSLKEIHYFDERAHDPTNPVLRLPKKMLGKRDVDRRWRRQVKNRASRHLRRTSGEPLFWDLKYYLGGPGDGWYASLFEPGRGKTVGEITPAYSTLGEDAVAHVHRLAPDAKIVFMIRNPIERAWSQAVMRFDKAKGRGPGDAGEESLRRLFGREGSRARTDYTRTLANWGAFYPEDRIFVGFLEDVHFFPGELLHRIYEFLGVDPSFRPPWLERKVHTRSSGTMPKGVATHLARSYREEMSRLDERFGGYASFWRFCAQGLAEGDAEDPVPYPFWGSSLWEGWLGEAATDGVRPRLQSGPLSPTTA